MNNEIMTFKHEQFGKLDVMQDNDKFLFPAVECARKLGYEKPEDAVHRHCPHSVKHGVGVQTGVRADGTPAIQIVNKIFIPEGDLYRLIIRSKLETAQNFESWVFDEVLPSIRKHGAYIMPELLEELQRNTAKNAELLSQLAKEQRSRQALEESNTQLQKLAGILKKKNDALTGEKQQLEGQTKKLESTVKENAPKVSYYDIIMQNSRAIPVTLIAKDYGLSAREFNARLHEYGIQFRVDGTWALYQDYAGNGYTHDNVYNARNTNRTVNHMCWTQKGRRFLYDFLKERGILPAIER
jgi:prophage antirepressor-like protein